MFITKSNIMFSAWQHNDGHGQAYACMNMCKHQYHALVEPISPSNDNYGFIKQRDQGAKSVDRKAFDVAGPFFFGFFSLFFLMRS